MGLRIQNNIEAFNTHRQLDGDGGAGLEVDGEALQRLPHQPRRRRRRRPRHLGEDARPDRRPRAGAANAQDGISLVQTAEGALSEVHSMLQRVRDLKVQSNNGTLDANDQNCDRRPRSLEISKEVTSIVDDTQFNGKTVFGSTDSFTFQVGANDSETISIAATNLDALGVAAGGLSALTQLAAAPSSARSPPRSAPAAWRDLRHRHDDRERLQAARPVRRGPEPPRAPSDQPGHLPGEPDGVGVAHPRRRHGVGDDQVHEAEHPAAGRHEHARAGQPGARRASCRCSR